MIMKAKAMINAALARSATPARRVVHPQGSPTPGLARPAIMVPVAPAPVALGHDDALMIFRSTLLRTERDGSELRAALDRMIERAPMIANQVIAAGSLGVATRARAVESLRGYLATGVAVAPTLGL